MPAGHSRRLRRPRTRTLQAPSWNGSTNSLSREGHRLNYRTPLLTRGTGQHSHRRPTLSQLVGVDLSLPRGHRPTGVFSATAVDGPTTGYRLGGLLPPAAAYRCGTTGAWAVDDAATAPPTGGGGGGGGLEKGDSRWCWLQGAVEGGRTGRTC